MLQKLVLLRHIVAKLVKYLSFLFFHDVVVSLVQKETSLFGIKKRDRGLSSLFASYQSPLLPLLALTLTLRATILDKTTFLESFNFILFLEKLALKGVGLLTHLGDSFVELADHVM